MCVCISFNFENVDTQMSNDQYSLYRICLFLFLFLTIYLFVIVLAAVTILTSVSVTSHSGVAVPQLKFKENRKICLQCLHSIKLLKRSSKDEPTSKKYGDCCKDLFENVSMKTMEKNNKFVYALHTHTHIHTHIIYTIHLPTETTREKKNEPRMKNIKIM